MNNFHSLLAAKWFALFFGLTFIASVFFFATVKFASAVYDNFDSLTGWQITGAPQQENFYCRSGKCVKLTSGGSHGYLSKSFEVQPGATYRVTAYGAVHNAANVSKTAVAEIGIEDSFNRVAVQCGKEKEVNCVGGGNPAGVYQLMSISKTVNSPTVTVTIKGWAGECNAFGCSESYIDDFNFDLIEPAPAKKKDGVKVTSITAPSPTISPTKAPTKTPAPTLTPTLTPTKAPKPTKTPTPSPTLTVSPTASPTPAPTVTVTPTVSPTVAPTSTPQPTAMPTLQPTTAPKGGVLTPAPQVKGATTEQLPKTGLPVAAWAIVGLLPAGMLLKRLGNQDSGRRNKETVQSIWKKRQFEKEE